MTSQFEDAAMFATPPFDRLVPARAGYQALPVSEGFNWSYTLEDVESGQWHLIVFRSRRSPVADRGLLTDHDDLAFAEALSSGGLLRYYKGAVDREGRCLSLCVWESVEHARVATNLPEHQAAAALTATFYESYEVERYVLAKHAGRLDPVMTLVSTIGRQVDQPVTQETRRRQEAAALVDASVIALPPDPPAIVAPREEPDVSSDAELPQ
jgi:hypothetical protein